MRITKEELLKRIETHNLPAAVFCLGQEAFFHEEILKALRASYAGEGGWGYEVVDAASLDPAKLAASAGTLSFGGGTKVTVVRSAHKLKKNQLEALQKIVTHPAKERKVVRKVLRALVIMTERELKPSDKLMAWAKKHKINICHFLSPKPGELKAWLKQQAAARDYSLDQAAVDFMVDLSAGNLMALSQVLEKIDLFREKKTRIALADVEDLLQDTFEKRVYDCVNAVFAICISEGKVPPALREQAAKELHRVLRFDPREGILQTIRALSREAFALLKYHELRDKGSTTEAMAKELRLGARKWLLQKEYPARARAWPAEKLHRLLKRLAEVDLAVRTTGRDPEAMLEQVVIGNLAPTSVEEFDEIFL
jgi:DNA polymerase III delta subunit